MMLTGQLKEERQAVC